MLTPLLKGVKKSKNFQFEDFCWFANGGNNTGGAP